MPTVTIIMTERTVCGGEIVCKDDVVEASDQDARQLVGSGKAELAADLEEAKDYSADSIQEMIILAIADLDPENTDHFTADNKPMVEALEEILDTDITAEQRDDAWAIVIENQG